MHAIPPSVSIVRTPTSPALRLPRAKAENGGLRYAVDKPLHVVDKYAKGPTIRGRLRKPLEAILAALCYANKPPPGSNAATNSALGSVRFGDSKNLSKPETTAR